jgi:hypothetical protein
MITGKLKQLSGVVSGDQIFTSSGTFTVPAGVTTLNIAIVPGNSRSTAVRSGTPLLIAAPGFTSGTYTNVSSLQVTVPDGVTSISAFGKGGDPYQTYTGDGLGLWTLASQSDYTWTVSPSTMTVPSNPPTPNGYYSTVTASKAGYTSIALYFSQAAAHSYAIYYTQAGDGWARYTYSGYQAYTTNNAGTSTTAALAGIGTMTWPGVGSGTATSYVQTLNIAYTSISRTLTITTGTSAGNIYYYWSAYARFHTSKMTGSATYNLAGNIVASGPYSGGGIAAWTNGISVTPGQTITANVSSGGAIKFMWGPGRSFPSNAT